LLKRKKRMKDIFSFISRNILKSATIGNRNFCFNNETDVNERGAPRDQVAESRGGEKRSTT